ncbi:hypothetical protein [Pseudoalteromonas denitrificans]|uniref:Uncharacterized protein n=1 Tax=Pseudoalteromonas denitrificans DSM 6059 TaxID=1123010 RepID=A0A1I1HCW9_9GAMM|nr:hypothetical protein [Pseudoalteromonas denitrificans]SFC21804.1 hypothetical protein SAMN02745724_01155 [Pseudoalteromonas denitrificans DSM 6059]
MSETELSYKITFNENKKEMWVVALFFIFVSLILFISSTSITSYLTGFITCILSYIFCHYKIDSIWPVSGSLLIFSKDKVQIVISNINTSNSYNEKPVIAKVLSSSLHCEYFIVLRLKPEIKNLGIKNRLVLKKQSMTAADFTRLRRMLVNLKNNKN